MIFSTAYSIWIQPPQFTPEQREAHEKALVWFDGRLLTWKKIAEMGKETQADRPLVVEANR